MNPLDFGDNPPDQWKVGPRKIHIQSPVESTMSQEIQVMLNYIEAKILSYSSEVTDEDSRHSLYYRGKADALKQLRTKIRNMFNLEECGEDE